MSVLANERGGLITKGLFTPWTMKSSQCSVKYVIAC